MTLKQFLKPNWTKIVIIVISMIISFPRYPNYYECSGFPLCYLSSGKCPFEYFVVLCGIGFLPVNLILDIIFWYLFSCLIIWIYDKVKKK